MISLATSFGNLAVIGSSGATTLVDGKPYSLVMTGLVRCLRVCVCVMMTVHCNADVD
jgi:hypothetical protein